MNDLELNEILDLIRVNYKNFFKNETKQEKSMLLKTWKYHFANVPQDVMFKLLMDYMATSTGFPPQVGHINKILYEKVTEDVGSAQESFSKIYKLVSSCGSDTYGYEKAYDQFNDIERMIINKGYWKELGTSGDKYGVAEASYTKRYNSKNESVSINNRKQLSSLDSIELLKGIKLLK
jgi:hypothetical protein